MHFGLGVALLLWVEVCMKAWKCRFGGVSRDDFVRDHLRIYVWTHLWIHPQYHEHGSCKLSQVYPQNRIQFEEESVEATTTNLLLFNGPCMSCIGSKCIHFWQCSKSWIFSPVSADSRLIGLTKKKCNLTLKRAHLPVTWLIDFTQELQLATVIMTYFA